MYILAAIYACMVVPNKLKLFCDCNRTGESTWFFNACSCHLLGVVKDPDVESLIHGYQHLINFCDR
jgi:hypothetical protein